MFRQTIYTRLRNLMNQNRCYYRGERSKPGEGSRVQKLCVAHVGCVRCDWVGLTLALEKHFQERMELPSSATVRYMWYQRSFAANLLPTGFRDLF